MKSSSRKRNAIYARYSSHMQDKGCSIEVQIEACQKLAGPDAVLYVDRAVSGRSMDRDAFNRMVSDAEAGRIGSLYIYKFDRFGRSAHAHGVVSDLEALGVSVVSATEGDEPLTRGISLVVAEDFSRRHGERVAASKHRRFREGRYHGGPRPYGYDVAECRLVVNQPEAATLRRLFARYLRDAVGLKQLAIWLTEQGARPRRSKDRWSSGSVRRMLKNRLYVGERAYRQYEYLDRPRRRGDDCEAETMSDESLRIIDQATFDRAQVKLEGRKITGYTPHHQTRRFSKLITCACCGSSFSRRYPAAHPEFTTWGCGLRTRWGRDKCKNSHSHRESELVARVDRAVRHVFDREEEIIEKAIAHARRLAGNDRGRRGQVEIDLAATVRNLDVLADRLTDPDLSADVTVKRLLVEKVKTATARRDELAALQARLDASTHQNGGGVEEAVKQAFIEAKRSMAEVATDSEFNAFVSEWFGPMLSDENGILSAVDSPLRARDSKACSFGTRAQLTRDPNVAS